jgi:hypothetical protein
MPKKLLIVTNKKDLKKATAITKKNEVVVLDEGRPTKAQLKKWANQKVCIKCTMHEAGDLMDLLFMADAGPFNNAFRDTLKLNKMTKSYWYWLDKMIAIVCPEISRNKNARTTTNKKNRRKSK